MSARSICICLLVVLASLAATAQDWSTATYPVGSASGILLADVNSDGWPDIVTTYRGGTNGYSVLLNQGGSFSAPQELSTTSVQRLIAADFNNDGRVDFARCNQQGVAIFLNQGNLAFTKTSTTTATCDFAVGDFNHDGKVDFATIDRVYNSYGQYQSSTVTVYAGNGAGGVSGTIKTTGLGAATSTHPAYFYTLQAAGDLTRDGYADLAVSEDCAQYDCYEAYAGILVNDATGHFGYQRLYTSSLHVDSIYLRDLNQDGWLDMLMNSQEEADYTRRFTALFHQSDGTYSTKTVYSKVLESGNSYTFAAPAFGDWDGDGYKDIAFTEAYFQEGADNQQYWLRLLYPANNAMTIMKPSVGITVSALGDTVSADFDRDGRPDLAFLQAGTLDVYLNRAASAPVCSASTAPLRTVKLCKPAPGATLSGRTQVVAVASSGGPISATKIYIDGVSRFTTYDNLVNAFLAIDPGAHKVTVKSWDALGSFSASDTFTVTSSCGDGAANRTITICSPLNGATVSNPVHLFASVSDTASVSVKVYVDGVSQYTTTSKSIDTSFTLAAGSHKITVRAWDASGNFSTSASFSVN